MDLDPPHKVAPVYIPASVRATTHQPSFVVDTGSDLPIAGSSTLFNRKPFPAPSSANLFTSHLTQPSFDLFSSSSSGAGHYSQPGDIPRSTQVTQHENTQGDQAEILTFSYQKVSATFLHSKSLLTILSCASNPDKTGRHRQYLGDSMPPTCYHSRLRSETRKSHQ